MAKLIINQEYHNKIDKKSENSLQNHKLTQKMTTE